MKKIRWKLLLGTAILALAAGCGQGGQETSGRQNVERSGKEITVIDNPESVSYGNTEANPLVRINNARGSEWLSDDQIITMKENTAAKPVVVEGTPWRPLNLVAHTVSSEQETELAPGGENQGYATANAARTHIFYKTFDIQSNTGTGFIMDLKTRKSVQITGKDELELTNGVWMDDRTVMYASLEGTIFSVSVDGSGKKVLLQTKRPMISNVSIAGNVVYYIGGRNELYAHALETGKSSVIAKNVVWAVPSPDGSQLALVIRSNPAMLLTVTDSKGGSPENIVKANGSQLFGISWSPDGKQIAYAEIGDNGTTKGIFVTDVSGGQPTALPVDVKFVADSLRWSPSGSRLMVSASSPGENGGKPVDTTYLAAVK